MKLTDNNDIVVHFNRKEFDIDEVPQDLLMTRAAGDLSQHVLHDMCQGQFYAQVELVDNSDNASVNVGQAPLFVP